MSSLPLRLRLLLLAAAIFGVLALAGFGEALAQSPALLPGTLPLETAALPHPLHTGPSPLSARIQEGSFTVDGLIAQPHLNYEVQDANFMYLFVPGIGTAVVSATPTSDPLQTPVTISGTDLQFTAAGHVFRVSGITLGVGGVAPSGLYVHLDTAAWQLSRRAMVGFGMRAERPYAWPSALASAQPEVLGTAVPVPSRLMPAVASPRRTTVTPAQVAPATLHPAVTR